MIKVCGWHKLYFSGAGMFASSVEPNNWRQITPQILEILIKTKDISHGLCPACAEKLNEEIEKEEQDEKDRVLRNERLRKVEAVRRRVDRQALLNRPRRETGLESGNLP